MAVPGGLEALRKFNGTWIQESQTGRDEFLKAFGMGTLMRKFAAKFKPKITIKVIADNAYREQSSALELDRIIMFDQEIENEIPRIACGMSITSFDIERKILFMKFRCTESKSRETSDKCLVPVGKLVERTREIRSDGKLEQIVTVEGVTPYKVVYRRKKEDEKIESSEDEGEESEEETN